MNPPSDDRDDPIEELLQPRSDVPGNESLRRTLLDQTAQRLRPRRWPRTASWLALAAASFLLGLASMWLLQPAPSPATVVVVTVAGPATPSDESPRERPLSPAELELVAEKTLVRIESARRFREAGDRYLSDEGNYQAALRCYRNFLDEAGEADLAVADTDNWLLKSLKNSRLKEKTDANSGI